MTRPSRKKKKAAETSLADMRSLGRRIRQLRGFDLSQQEFAHRLGVSQSQLSKYERGVVAPPADVLIRLKEEFKVSVDWLLTGDR